MSLTIPDDHPVRKLFQKFRQQRDAQTPESAAHGDHNCVQVESHQPTHPSAPPQLQDNAAGGAALPPENSCVSQAREGVEGQEVGGSSAGGAPGGDGAAGRAAGPRGPRGWAKFRNATSAAVEKQQEEPPEQLGGADKKQEEETEGAEGGSRAGEEGAETSTIHKTDSCDSGITVRIDRAGDSRSSCEKSPMEKSPAERNPFEQTLGVDPLKHSPAPPPPSEQTLLQALLHQAKLELKGDIQILSGRLSILESQVSEVLRLLSIRRRLSLPPISSPRLRGRSQDLAAAPTPALTEADD